MCTAVEESGAPICVVTTRMIGMPKAIVASIDLDQESVHSSNLMEIHVKTMEKLENVCNELR